jgi:hypothetical protein
MVLPRWSAPPAGRARAWCRRRRCRPGVLQAQRVRGFVQQRLPAVAALVPAAGKARLVVGHQDLRTLVRVTRVAGAAGLHVAAVTEVAAAAHFGELHVDHARQVVQRVAHTFAVCAAQRLEAAGVAGAQAGGAFHEAEGQRLLRRGRRHLAAGAGGVEPAVAAGQQRVDVLAAAALDAVGVVGGGGGGTLHGAGRGVAAGHAGAAQRGTAAGVDGGAVQRQLHHVLQGRCGGGAQRPQVHRQVGETPPREMLKAMAELRPFRSAE